MSSARQKQSEIIATAYNCAFCDRRVKRKRRGEGLKTCGYNECATKMRSLARKKTVTGKTIEQLIKEMDGE